MSRNLVPPEVFATLHDAVKDNGAQIHLCCDPSRNGPNDYHIISCSKHVIHPFHSQIAFSSFSFFFVIYWFFSLFFRRNLKILNRRDVKCLVRVFSYRFLWILLLLVIYNSIFQLMLWNNNVIDCLNNIWSTYRNTWHDTHTYTSEKIEVIECNYKCWCIWITNTDIH